ncbi:Cupredoxin [Mycena metata]|uniref:Cupredoxin n=1 Tax=Mycena metata TaxID=1033252 RepID=A0AAD7JXT4_9AGAR|nr:Cupredoxin [Mycena metata]
MFSKFTTIFAVSCLSLAVIPVRSATINVTVGGTGVIAYTPNFVQANVGDVVQFIFQQKNHTITQSTLASPCSPKADGFDSGFVPVAADVTDNFPLAQLTVTDTNPIWIYCRQTGHCSQGMVFAVNPGNNMAAFQAAAAATGGSASPNASASATAGVVTVTATVTVGGQAVTTTYASSPASASSTAVSSDHVVIVGGTAGLVYSPSNITAQPGDTVTFQFHSKNHTATQSSFASPCRALSSTSTTGQTGFDSGFMPVDANATQFPTYTIQINDTTPIWVYCRQLTHCGSGMTFSVNAVEPNSFAAFQAKAIQLNGTANGTASAVGSTDSTNGAVLPVRSAAAIMALVGVVAGLVL